jgi:hypothetical protein
LPKYLNKIISKNFNFIAVAAVILFVGMIYFWFNPATSGWFFKCPFLYVTGYQCPGCGSQRALHELLHLNIKEAFNYNPLFVISIPYVVAALLFQIPSVKDRFPKTNQILFGFKTWLIILVIILLFFVLRNI